MCRNSPSAKRHSLRRGRLSALAKGERDVYFDHVHVEGAGAARTPVYERDRLDPGAVLAGPAIIEQFDATTAIPPGWHAAVDAFRNIVLTKRGA